MSENEPTRRQCILEQAQRLFLALGYHGVSIRDIVHACGLSNAALYYHFRNKRDLFVQVFLEYITRATEQVRQAGSQETSCRRRLTSMAAAYATYGLDSRSEMQALRRDLMQLEQADIKDRIHAALREVPSLFATVLEEGISAGELRPLDAQRVGGHLVGMLNALTARRMFGQQTTLLSDDIDLAIAILYEGIGRQS